MISARLADGAGRIVHLFFERGLFRIRIADEATIGPLYVFLTVRSGFVGSVMKVIFGEGRMTIVTDAKSFRTVFFIPLDVFGAWIFDECGLYVRLGPYIFFPLLITFVSFF